MLDYIHGKGVGAMMSVWSMADALRPAVDASYNPSEVASHADSRDVYLLESWAFNSDALASPHYMTFSDVKTRGDAARTWRTSSGVRMYAANILRYTGAEAAIIRRLSRHGGSLAHIWRLDGSGVAVSHTPYKPLIGAMPDRRLTAPYTLNGAGTEVLVAIWASPCITSPATTCGRSSEQPMEPVVAVLAAGMPHRHRRQGSRCQRRRLFARKGHQ